MKDTTYRNSKSEDTAAKVHASNTYAYEPPLPFLFLFLFFLFLALDCAGVCETRLREYSDAKPQGGRHMELTPTMGLSTAGEPTPSGSLARPDVWSFGAVRGPCRSSSP